MTAKLLLWYFYKGKSDSVEICQWRWQCKYPNKSDFHWADLLIIKFLITCSSCFIPIGKDWKNVGCLPRDQLSLSGLKQTSNLITNILSPYSSTIQANKPFIYVFFCGGEMGSFYNKKWVLSLAASKGRFSTSFMFSVAVSCHCGLTCQIGSSWF